MTKHELKILPKYFDDVKDHIKNFEVRSNDRDYQVGDILVLKEWNEGKFTGRFYTTSVIYVLDNPDMLADGYVVLGLAVPTTNIKQVGVNNYSICSVGTLNL